MAYYGSQAVLVTLILVVGLKLWRKDLTVPFVLAGDALHHLLIAKALTEQGWWWHVTRLSAPFSLPMVAFPVGGNVDYLLVKLLTLFTSEAGLALNLFWLGSIVLGAMTAAWSLNRLSVAAPVSFVVGVLFALLPHTFYRCTSHLMLVTYLLPPVLALAVMVALPHRLPAGRRERGLLLLGTFLLGLNYVYTTCFAAFCLVVGGLLGLLRTGSRRSLKWCALSLTILCVAAALNLTPSVIYWLGDWPTQLLVRGPKSAVEADVYALKLRHLLLPVHDHFIPLLARLDENYQQVGMPFENGESTAGRLGLLGSAGFLFLLLVNLRPWPMKEPRTSEMLEVLAGLTLAALLLGIIGGFGSLLSLVVSPDIRAYARISVVIGFYSFAALALLLSHAIRSTRSPLARRSVWLPTLAGLLLFGILDQYSAQHLVGRYELDAQKYRNVGELVGKLESVLPMGAAVYQLPYTAYPHTPVVAGMSSNEHLVAYTASRHLRWSWPALTARASAWDETVSTRPAPEFVATLALAGFEAVWVNRAGYDDAGAALIRDLTEVTGLPLAASSDGGYIVFGLAEFRRRIARVLSRDQYERAAAEALEAGLYQWGEPLNFDRPHASQIASRLISGWAAPDDGGFRWTQGRRALVRFLVRPSSGDKILSIRIDRPLAYRKFPVKVWIDDEAVGKRNMVREREYTLTIPSRLLAGKESFILRLDTPAADSPKNLGVNADPRVLGLAVREIAIRESLVAQAGEQSGPAALPIHLIASRALQAGAVYRWGQHLLFTRQTFPALLPFLVSGWTPALENETFRWTEGRRASMRFLVESTTTDKVLAISIHQGLPYTSFPVIVSIDDEQLGRWNMVDQGEYSLRIPGRVLAGKSSFVLTLDMPVAVSPRQLGVNSDDRILGLAVRDMALLETPVRAAK